MPKVMLNAQQVANLARTTHNKEGGIELLIEFIEAQDQCLIETREELDNLKAKLKGSNLEVATYHSPTCNEHIDLEQAEDATCAYCRIEELER